MKYFLDTEFREDFEKPLFGKRRHIIDLISIGIVAEDGRQYYAVNKQFDLKKAWKNQWLQDNVLKALWKDLYNQESIYTQTYHWDLIDFSYKGLRNLIKCSGKSREQIKIDILKFTGCKKDSTGTWWAPDDLPEFHGYFADYDWVTFCALFGRMLDLPRGYPMYCKDLKQMFDERALQLTSLEASLINYPKCNHDVYSFLEKITDGSYKINVLKKHKDYPKQCNEHHALFDAKWNLQLFNFINRV